MARAWVSLSRALKFRGDFSGADRAAARALEVDAYLVDAHRAAGDLFFGALGRGDYKGAGDLCAAGRRYYGSARSFVECRLTLLGWSANSREDVRLGWELLQEIELQGSSTELAETWGFRRLMVAAVAARSGLRDSARAIIRATRAAVQERSPQLLPALAFSEAYVYSLVGDTISALAALGSALREQPQRRPFVAEHPWFLSLRDDPRFKALVSR